jgi:asparagine synthase (glutamine-hydrolysing)
VLVHGYEQWGSGLPARLNGMFAFAVWDARSRELLLARDRFGIKPLYTASLPDGGIVFGSEVRAILASGLVEKREDLRGLGEYLSFQNLWTGRTLFAGIELFPAAHWERRAEKRTVRRRYWELRLPRGARLGLRDAAEAHREILRRAVRRQLQADVPVMTYLSGGIDSSSVTAMAHEVAPQMRAYTCLFNLDGVGSDRINDEREFARATARHLGIRHEELEVPPDALGRRLDDTVRALEYPRMGMSYVNYLIAKRAARDTKVILSGMGGDELHGGYLYRYQLAGRKDGPAFWLGRLWRRARGRSPGLEAYRDNLNYLVPQAQLADAVTPEIRREVGGFSASRIIEQQVRRCPSSDPWDVVMYVDTCTYLQGLLIVEDKLSMAHSLETRVPLLDDELVEFVTDLPWPLLCDGHTGKRIFRESVRPWVSDEVYRKPKMGFGPPDASWYRGALRPWIETELSERRIRRRGIFRPDYVRHVLDEHFSGAADHVHRIWSFLSLESWCRVFGMFGG